MMLLNISCKNSSHKSNPEEPMEIKTDQEGDPALVLFVIFERFIKTGLVQARTSIDPLAF